MVRAGGTRQLTLNQVTSGMKSRTCVTVMDAHRLILVVLYVISFLMIFGGFRVLLKSMSSVNNLQLASAVYNCCECYFSTISDISYTAERHKNLFGNGTLTRIGSNLDFDYGSCPKDSVMWNQTKLNSKPLHDDCPQVFIIGARKGGTTSLYQYLSKHPDFEGVQLDRGPSAGETFYFSSRYDSVPWEHYKSGFPVNKITGESSVGNLVNCRVPERLYTSCGRTVKVIVLLRHPLERYQSNFRMRVRLSAKQTNSFSRISTLMMAEIHHLYGIFEKQNLNMNDLSSNVNLLLCLFHPAENCIYEGLYYIHLHNWLCNFPAGNILILNSEEFFKSPKRIFSQVLDFINLKPLDENFLNEITMLNYNPGGMIEAEPDFRLLSLSDKKTLQTIYTPFNKKLFELLRWQNVSWSSHMI